MEVRETVSMEQLSAYEEALKPLKAQRKKGSRGMRIFLLICVIFGGFIGFFGAMTVDKLDLELAIQPPFPLPERLGFLYGFAAIAAYFVMMVLHTIIHEGGHLLFGIMTGYQFLSFRVFSFTIVKKDGKLMRKKLKVPGTLGQCLMIPPEWSEETAYPYVWYNLGGGIMNILACLLVMPLLLAKNPFWVWFAGFFLFLGFIFAFSNLIPMSIGVPNDGKNCLACKRSRTSRKAFYLQLKINALLSTGVSFSELSDDLFEISDDEPLDMLTAYIRLLRYYRYLQKGEEKLAEELLTEIGKQFQNPPLGFVNGLDLERFGRMVLTKAPLEQIAAYYNVLRPVFAQGKDISILRIRYAYLLFLSDEERERIDWLVASKKGKLPKKLPKSKAVTAEAVLADMQKACDKHPVPGEAELFMELARMVKEKAEAEAVKADAEAVKADAAAVTAEAEEVKAEAEAVKAVEAKDESEAKPE